MARAAYKRSLRAAQLRDPPAYAPELGCILCYAQQATVAAAVRDLPPLPLLQLAQRRG